MSEMAYEARSMLECLSHWVDGLCSSDLMAMTFLETALTYRGTKMFAKHVLMVR